MDHHGLHGTWVSPPPPLQHTHTAKRFSPENKNLRQRRSSHSHWIQTNVINSPTEPQTLFFSSLFRSFNLSDLHVQRRLPASSARAAPLISSPSVRDEAACAMKCFIQSFAISEGKLTFLYITTSLAFFALMEGLGADNVPVKGMRGRLVLEDSHSHAAVK